jgi:hypothetical protein
MPKPFRPIVKALFLAGLLLPPAAHAQYYNFYSSPEFLQSNVTTPSWQASQRTRERAQDNLRQSTPRYVSPPRPAQPSANRTRPTNAPLPYTRDRALSTTIRNNFLADFSKQMPGAATWMRETATKNDLVHLAAFLMKKQGLDSASMEGITAFWYAQSWAVANQRPLPTALQYQGLANQLRNNGAKRAEWAAMSNPERQSYYERLAYPLVVPASKYEA